ncbi:AzlC family ABC transporter permease [Aquicoccus sp.]|uniref:AzlC family ABC transporter permease n=1 Tax=Aquicoccus sp. TaxID=2055851 RepID=UPI0035667448
MTADLGLRAGMRAAMPIAAAYLPVAFALGAASSQLGFSILGSALWSAIMFSGANQALLLSGLSSEVPLAILAFLAIAASLRHVLYGVALAERLDASSAGRAIFAYGLTDEVFATTLTAYEARDRTLPARWLVGLAVSALGIWIIGTTLGSAVGDVLRVRAPGISAALDFALPALFVGLVWSTASRSMLGRMLLSATLSAFMIFLGRPELAIPAGALPAFIPDRRIR